MPESSFQHDIFLSYARDDRERVKVLANTLTSLGWSVWWDRRIPTGKRFAKVIEEQLDASRTVVVVWSKISVHSDWVHTEAAEGSRRDALFPVLIDEVTIPLEFRRVQAADLIHWQGDTQDEQWQLLVSDLTFKLGPPRGSSPSVPPNDQKETEQKPLETPQQKSEGEVPAKPLVHDLETLLGPSLIKTKGKDLHIFISYRREDSMAYAGRLFDRLADRFGLEKIFMDIDTMKVGLDFVKQIEHAVQSCDVLIAVIGKTWLTIKDEEGNRRLDNPDDFVRVEIRAALERDIPVIPLLVGGTGMPRATELPDAIANLARRHAMKMSDDRFRADATRLIEQISEYVTEAESEPPLPPSEPEPTTPEGMVLIPKGPFLYGDDRIRENIPHDIWIDVHPVTNAWYTDFILADGYGSQIYWSEEGWALKEENQMNRPEYWTDATWNQADYPIVGVSYYEAEAYAKWAGKRLPTEQEWEKAARGTDGRTYPWGEEFDANRCACSVKGERERTTPIGTFPDGQSPYGCQDMAGNVWEWCTSWFDVAKERRVLQGGSWSNFISENFRCSLRVSNIPRLRDHFIGFRCAQDAL